MWVCKLCKPCTYIQTTLTVWYAVPGNLCTYTVLQASNVPAPLASAAGARPDGI